MLAHKGTQVLETERLILRPFRAGDGDAMFRNWTSDPEVTRYLTWPTHTDPAVSEQLARIWEEEAGDPAHYQWAIVPKAVGEPIGSISAVEIREKISSIEIGYCIGRKWWGNGLTAEALRCLISFFHDRVGAARVCARHDVRNPNSGRVMQKAGMEFEAVIRASAANNSGIADMAWYTSLR